MSELVRQIVLLVIQFLDEKNYTSSARRLEEETGFFFNMKYFEDGVLNGNWDEIERYLSGFIKYDDNSHSTRTFFEIRKQKYLEALDKHDRTKALDILKKDLKVLSTFNEEIFKDMTLLLTLDNFRESAQLSNYRDVKSARDILLLELKKLIEANPLLRDKLKFPDTEKLRLFTLINQSLNWQHLHCKNPKPMPVINTLFVDHSCGRPNSPAIFQPTSAAVPAPCACLSYYPTEALHPSFSAGALNLGAPTIGSTIVMNYKPGTYSDHISNRARPMKIADDGKLSKDVQTASSGCAQALDVSDDLPKTVARTLNQGSVPLSMDFHPVVPTILLVGTNVGDLMLWDVGIQERLVLKNFKVWDLSSCSLTLQAAMAKDPCVSVTRVMWSPDGTWFGVAYSMHILQLYTYHGIDDARQHLQIDAHVGSVNDLAFVTPKRTLSVITCGDDKLIKVWDALTGRKQYTLKGSEAPVYSICPHIKGGIEFIFSNSLDGKIRAWLYDNFGPRLEYCAPGGWRTAMAQSADGTRLFSCGTSIEGESYLVEWNVSKGVIKRMYQGFMKRSFRVVQFDPAGSKFLAAGDDFSVKFWDMDNIQLLAATDAGGGLLKSSRVRFNKDGTLLAVSASENGIKILANSKGLELLRLSENRVLGESRMLENLDPPMVEPTINASVAAPTIVEVENGSPSIAAGSSAENAETGIVMDIKATIVYNGPEKVWNITEIKEPGDCRSSRLPTNLRKAKISRLIYTNSGRGILALASNATHLLWKWPHNGKATTDEPVVLWQPRNGLAMTNDTTGVNLEDAVPCFALSKNDSYLLSASGGKISLFNMVSFKRMLMVMPPPPVASFLAFHPPNNNIVAIGMNDSTIVMYNVHQVKVMGELRGHSKRITGLAFSDVLHVLVSSGADAQVFVWDVVSWEKKKSKTLQIPAGLTATTSQPDTHVQFHQDQTRFLVVHESQISLYDATELECLKQWSPLEFAPLISDATFSCDGQLIYASFLDATVCVFDTANLSMQCRINPSAYVPNRCSKSSAHVHPLVIAAHPDEPDQFALGMSDGSVLVLEPVESQGRWGAPQPVEKGSVQNNGLSLSSSTNAVSGLNEPQK